MGMEFHRRSLLTITRRRKFKSRMMNALPEGIDDMPGGFPYDFTMPTAIEKSELIQFHLVTNAYAHVPPVRMGRMAGSSRLGCRSAEETAWLCQRRSYRYRRGRNCYHGGIYILYSIHR